jgi:hypothetical protein
MHRLVFATELISLGLGAAVFTAGFLTLQLTARRKRRNRELPDPSTSSLQWAAFLAVWTGAALAIIAVIWLLSHPVE